MKNLLLKIVLTGAQKISGPFKAAGGASQKLNGQVSETAKKIKGLEQASRDLTSFSRLKDRSSQNADALKEAQIKAQSLGRAMAGTDKITKRMSASFEVAQKRVRRLKGQQAGFQQQISTVRQKLERQGIATNNVSQAQRKLGMRIRKSSQDMDGYSRKLDQARIKTNKLTKAKNNFNRSMAQKANMSIAGAAGVATGRTMLSGAASMIRPGIDFEEQMSKVGALARIDKTSAQFKELNALAKELGKTTHFSATQSAEGMGFLAMAGFETNAIIKTMPGLLNLAKAGAMELGQTADIASNILSGFGLESDQMGRVSDVLTSAFTRANVDLSMLGDTMKYVSPIAKTLKIPLEEASAMAGLMGNVGIQGAKAGTSLRAIMSRMAAPPAMAQKALSRLGLGVKDAAGNMRPMIDILGDVAKKTEKMGTAVRLGFFKHIAGEEAGSAFAELVDRGGAGAITKFTDILKNSSGEAARIAKQMGDNTTGDITEFGSAWESVNIALTETNTNPMREIIQLGTQILRSTTAWIKANPELAGTLFKVFAGAALIVTVMGGMALALAGILGPFAMLKFGMMTLGIKMASFGGALTSIGKIFPLIGVGIKALTGLMLTNPITALIVGIASAGILLYNTWEPFRAFIDGFWDKFTLGLKRIKSMFSSGGSFIGKMANAIGGGMSSLFGSDDGAAGSKKPMVRKIATAAIATAAVSTPAMGAAAAPVQNSHVYEINITAGPGTDAGAIAEAVRLELERIQANQDAQARSKLYD